MQIDSETAGWRETGSGEAQLVKAVRKRIGSDIVVHAHGTFDWDLSYSRYATDHLGDSIILDIYHTFYTSNWTLTRCKSDEDVIMSFPLRGYMTFGFADKHITVHPGQAIIYMQSDEIQRSSYVHGTNGATLSMKLSLLKARQVIARRYGQFDRRKTEFRHVLTDENPQVILVKALIQVLSNIDHAKSIAVLPSDTRYSIINTIAQLISDILYDNDFDKFEHSISNAAPFVRKACQYIRDHFRERLSVHHIAKHCAVSVRKLERGFAEGLGLPPTSYIKNVRLEAIYEALKSRNFNRPITTFAAECGYTSRHRFRADYIAKYGETPQETLATYAVK